MSLLYNRLLLDEKMFLLHSCSSRTLSTIARMDPIPSVSPSANLLLLTGSFLPLGLQDPFVNYYYCSSTCIVPIIHRYGRYPYQVYYIPAICRYWWGTAIPSTPIKGCTNACLLHTHIYPKEILLYRQYLEELGDNSIW